MRGFRVPLAQVRIDAGLVSGWLRVGLLGLRGGWEHVMYRICIYIYIIYIHV